ncbi:MAG: copper amine oxidase N-terminal domain-containing protein [Firmicutes bacterium]|nr:copper amine oxidase N-terminal domain-containing protein [Bacillota bacterium]
MKRASILAVVLAFAMLLTANVAFAATDNYAVSVPKVSNDSENVQLGDLVIKEDSDTDGYFAQNQVITINLPAGVEFMTAPTVGDVVYAAGPATDYIDATGTGFDWKIVAADDNYVTVEAISGSSANDAEKLKFTFNVNDTSKADIDDDVTGDVKIEIDAAGTPITSEYVTVARIVGGDTTTTVSDVEDLAIDSTGSLATIKIAENAAGVLTTSENIKLVLPNDIKWVYSSVNVNSVGLTADKAAGGSDDEELEIDVTAASSGQPGFITVTGNVIVPDDADEGEVELTVKGNEVTEEDIVVAKIGDFGFELETDGDIEEIVAGADDEEVVDITIDEIVPSSWIQGRTVTLELPSWAEWSYVVDESPLGSGSIDSDDPEEAKWTVGSGSGKAELNGMKVNIDADAPEGDLTVKVYGSAGVEGELVIAKIVKPFEVTAEKPEVIIGVQNQQLGEITITETKDGAIDEDKWVVIKAPYGFNFTDDYDVEVVEGDMDIDDDDVDGRYLAFKVTGDSDRDASVIKISNIEFDVDRTVPVGDITFEVFLTKTDKVASVSDFDDAIDDDNYEDVANVVVGEVVTPAPDEQGNSALFTIGSSIYNVNGTAKAMDAAPYVKDGRTFTPVRYVAEAIGAAVDYDAATKTVTLTKGDDVVTLVLGSTTITVNGTASQMDVAAEVNNGRTMLPARFVAEAFGYNVGFDPATKAVVISK